MPAKRAAYHHGDLRETLLRAAERAIESGGVTSLSVRALALEAGVAHRAAYRHFQDKDDLLAAVLTRAYGRLEESFARGISASEPRARLVEIAQAYAELSFVEPQMFLAMTGPRVNLDNKHDELEQALRKAFYPMVEAVRTGQEQSLFAPGNTEASAFFFWASLQGVLVQIIHERMKLKPTQRRLYIQNIAHRLLAALEHDPKRP